MIGLTFAGVVLALVYFHNNFEIVSVEKERV